MAVISKGTTFATGDQVTASKLNNLADNATFASGAVDSVSTQLSGGAIIVKDGGVSTAKIADDSVTTAKIASSAVTTTEIADNNVTTSKIADSNVTTAKLADSNVTKAKIENVANMKVLGNTSGSAATPQEVAILDQDDMSSDSAIALATQQSIKAYVDDKLPSNHIVAVQDLVNTSNTATLNYDSVTGDNVSNSGGVLTITGAGLWALTCNAEALYNSEKWSLEFRVNDVSIFATPSDYSNELFSFSGTTFYTSTGSFNIRVTAVEVTTGGSIKIENLRVEAVKLA
jgi:hypothetical protein